MPDTSPTLTRPLRAIGRAFTLLLVPTGVAAPLGPTWAVLCGVCAAMAWQWQGTYFREFLDTSLSNTLLALLLTMFVAEALWSTWRALLVDVNWAALFTSYPLPAHGDPVLQLPYTAPWSPLGRFLRQWGRTRRWLRETTSTDACGALFSFPILPPLILLLSVAIGWQMVVLSLAALSLTLIEWLVARRGGGHTALQAGLEIGLAWLAGHVLLRPLTWSSLTLACCYAIAYQGALSLDRTLAPKDLGRSWSLGLFYGGQIAALALLVLLRHPLAATIVGVLLAPQLLLLPRFDGARPAPRVWPDPQSAPGSGEPTPPDCAAWASDPTGMDAPSAAPGERSTWYLQRAAPFLMTAMLVAAWVV